MNVDSVINPLYEKNVFAQFSQGLVKVKGGVVIVPTSERAAAGKGSSVNEREHLKLAPEVFFRIVRQQMESSRVKYSQEEINTLSHRVVDLREKVRDALKEDAPGSEKAKNKGSLPQDPEGEIQVKKNGKFFRLPSFGQKREGVRAEPIEGNRLAAAIDADVEVVNQILFEKFLQSCQSPEEIEKEITGLNALFEKYGNQGRYYTFDLPHRKGGNISFSIPYEILKKIPYFSAQLSYEKSDADETKVLFIDYKKLRLSPIDLLRVIRIEAYGERIDFSRDSIHSLAFFMDAYRFLFLAGIPPNKFSAEQVSSLLKSPLIDPEHKRELGWGWIKADSKSKRLHVLFDAEVHQLSKEGLSGEELKSSLANLMQMLWHTRDSNRESSRVRKEVRKCLQLLDFPLAQQEQFLANPDLEMGRFFAAEASFKEAELKAAAKEGDKEAAAKKEAELKAAIKNDYEKALKSCQRGIVSGLPGTKEYDETVELAKKCMQGLGFDSIQREKFLQDSREMQRFYPHLTAEEGVLLSDLAGELESKKSDLRKVSPKVVNILKVLAQELGDEQALLDLSHPFFNEYHLTNLSIRKSQEYLNRALKLENREALYLNGSYYLNMDFNQSVGDKVLIFNQLKRAAEKGHPKAWHAVGRCYELGFGTRKDVDQAIECYKKSIELKDLRGLIRLGNLLIENNESLTEKDAQQAFAYYDEAQRSALDEDLRHECMTQLQILNLIAARKKIKLK